MSFYVWSKNFPQYSLVMMGRGTTRTPKVIAFEYEDFALDRVAVKICKAVVKPINVLRKACAGRTLSLAFSLDVGQTSSIDCKSE